MFNYESLSGFHLSCTNFPGFFSSFSSGMKGAPSELGRYVFGRVAIVLFERAEQEGEVKQE